RLESRAAPAMSREKSPDQCRGVRPCAGMKPDVAVAAAPGVLELLDQTNPHDRRCIATVVGAAVLLFCALRKHPGAPGCRVHTVQIEELGGELGGIVRGHHPVGVA